MIPVSEPLLKGNELKYVQDCFETGWISSIGKYVNAFEEKFAEFCNVPYSVAVMNGTCALHLALTALGIKEGDEVLVPNFTFVATANVVKYCGAKPVFVDIDPEIWNINPNLIEEHITTKTRAIIPVHLYGHPVDMDPILAIARKHNLKVIEDCAEAHGALYKGNIVGSMGDVGCFSFYANKIITTGEGGMIVTKDKALYEKLLFLRDHAMSKEKKYWHPEIGFNYRLTNIQAAIGLAQMEKIEEHIAIKRRNAQLYQKYLAGIKGISLQNEKEWAKNVYWMYSILITAEEKISRNTFIDELKKQGIDSRPFFYPMTVMPPYKEEQNDAKYPISMKISAQGCNLPSSCLLREEQIQYIAAVIRKIME